jgi:type 1 glutamine amidotransferase
MKLISKLLLLTCLLVGISLSSCQTAKTSSIQVLLITGGHDYDKEPFARLLAALPATIDQVEHPNAYPLLKAESIAKYDAVILYDMPATISEEARRDIVAMLEKGKGVIVLHHALGSDNSWPEFIRIAGGLYHFEPWIKEGVEQPAATFKHGVDFTVKVADSAHPVTKGISDFQIHDETYNYMEILPTVHPLLATDEPTSAPLIAWTNTYGNSRIVTLMLGHDSTAWENPSFIKFLSQSIQWVAGENSK